MNIADIAIAIALALFVFSGFFEGFIKKIFGIIILLAAFFIAINLYTPFSAWMQQVLKFSPFFSIILAFILIFLGFLIGGNVLFRAVGKKNELYRGWDKIAGAAFGLFEGALIVSIILHLVLLVEIPPASMRESSWLYSSIYGFAPTVFEWINIFIPQIREFFEIFIRDAPGVPEITV